MDNSIILEDGYNTDYIYSLILALFYSPSEGLTKIINTDTQNSNTYYIQEFIKAKFIYPIHRGLSIESSIANKLRVFMYNCGWMKDNGYNIVDNPNIDEFYHFLINKMMEYKLEIIRVDPIDNISDTKVIDIIRITDEHLTKGKKIIDLSEVITNWTKKEIIQEKYNYKFGTIPLLVPVYLDIKDPNTGLNSHYVNIMEGLKFEDVGDKIHRMFVWEIHSIVCQTENGSYYTIVKNNMDEWISFSDKKIPSNHKVNMTDINDVRKIMKEVRTVFYKIQ